MTNDSEGHLRAMQDRVANISIGAGTLRNQGAKGVTTIARKYLKSLNLNEFTDVSIDRFQELLTNKTNDLKELFPGNAKGNWGAARKAINVFLEEACYNRYLAPKYHLENIESYLEIPIDNYVINELKKASKNDEKLFSKWEGIKKLNEDYSNKIQTVARTIAKNQNIYRVHLDLYYWKKE